MARGAVRAHTHNIPTKTLVVSMSVCVSVCLSVRVCVDVDVCVQVTQLHMSSGWQHYANGWEKSVLIFRRPLGS